MQPGSAEAPEVVVPPKGRALRVAKIGGSNVAGFHSGHLQQALCRQLPVPGFEVVNLGRSGYGSERELILLRQARVLVATVVSNLFDPPYVSNPPGDWDEAQRAALAAARDRMLAPVPARLSFGLVPEGHGLRWPHPRTEDWGENITPAQRWPRATRSSRYAPTTPKRSTPRACAPTCWARTTPAPRRCCARRRWPTAR